MSGKGQPKNVLIVGGGTGMGKAIALKLSSNGDNVAISGRRQDKLNDVAAICQKTIVWHPVDVTDRKSVRSLFSWFGEHVGELDVLINAAGINVANRSMEKLDPEEWDQLIQINLTGAYNCLKEALNIMRPRNSGLVILINSVAGRRAVPLAGVGYNASKFGMSALGVSVAEEERENGIRITNIYPGKSILPFWITEYFLLPRNTGKLYYNLKMSQRLYTQWFSYLPGHTSQNWL